MTFDFGRLKALVVDDNRYIRTLTESVLRSINFGTIIEASDGQSGFERVQETNPDLIIADWKMEPMDGMAFTELIRNDPRTPNPYVPIIMLSGFSDLQRVQAARDKGITEFLAKPYSAKTLINRIFFVVENPRSFIKTPDYFGPNRRRRSDPEYFGPERRENRDTMDLDRIATG